jgi:hypothetical protein
MHWHLPAWLPDGHPGRHLDPAGTTTIAGLRRQRAGLIGVCILLAVVAVMASMSGSGAQTRATAQATARERERTAACEAARDRYSIVTEAVYQAAVQHVGAHVDWKAGNLRHGNYRDDFNYAAKYGTLRPNVPPSFLGMVGVFVHKWTLASPQWERTRAEYHRVCHGTGAATTTT